MTDIFTGYQGMFLPSISKKVFIKGHFELQNMRIGLIIQMVVSEVEYVDTSRMVGVMKHQQILISGGIPCPVIILTSRENISAPSLLKELDWFKMCG